MKETLILKTKLESIFDFHVIQELHRIGYKKTGCKFRVMFAGSKGYFSDLSVECEGVQNAENRIIGVFNQYDDIKKVTLNIFHSGINGVRLSLGDDEVRDYSEQIGDNSRHQGDSMYLWLKVYLEESPF